MVVFQCFFFIVTLSLPPPPSPHFPLGHTAHSILPNLTVQSQWRLHIFRQYILISQSISREKQRFYSWLVIFFNEISNDKWQEKWCILPLHFRSHETNSENSDINQLHVYFSFSFFSPTSGLNCPACLPQFFFFMSLFVHSSHSHSVIFMHFGRWHPHVILNMWFLIARSEKIETRSHIIYYDLHIIYF